MRETGKRTDLHGSQFPSLGTFTSITATTSCNNVKKDALPSAK